jgi:hypothetical protein
MDCPTPDEIKAAYDAITADGPRAEITHKLSIAAVMNPQLRDTIERMVTAAFQLGLVDSKDGMRGSLSGALIYGLHLGLHIGQQRKR